MTENVTVDTVVDAAFANRNLWNYWNHTGFPEQIDARWYFIELLNTIIDDLQEEEAKDWSHKIKLIRGLAAILVNGGIFIDNTKHTKHMSEYHKNEYGVSYDDANTISAWVDTANKLIVTLEWNKVKGVQERKYGFMAFMKKLLRTYGVWDYSQVPAVSYKAEDFEFLNELIFSEPEGMTVELWDKPSEIYDITSIDSCMVETDYVKFYDTAPVKGMVVMYKGKAISRNLLWSLPDGRRVTGRVYSSSSKAHKAIEKYCNENGIDRNFNLTDYVIAPYSEYGLPWQDDLRKAVRHNDNIVLFYECIEANKYLERNKPECLDRIYDACCTMGNHSSLRQKLVDCVNGGRIPQDEAVVFEGLFYNLANALTVTPYNYHRIDIDAIVRHPYRSSRLIRFSELVLHKGSIELKSQLIEFDGQIVHKNEVGYILSKEGDNFKISELTIHDNDGSSCDWFPRTYLRFIRHKYGLQDGVRIVTEKYHIDDDFYAYIRTQMIIEERKGN